MNRPFNFLIDPKTGTELMFPSHLLPSDFFIKKLGIKKEKQVIIPKRILSKAERLSILEKNNVETPTKEVVEEELQMERPRELCSVALEKNGYLGAIKKMGDKPLYYTADKNGTMKVVIREILDERGAEHMEKVLSDKNNPLPFILEKRIVCVEEGGIATVNLFVVNQKNGESIKYNELSPVLYGEDENENNEIIDDLLEEKEINKIISKMEKIHNMGWILGPEGANINNIYVQLDNDEMNYYFLKCNTTKKSDNPIDFLLDLFYLYKSINENEKFIQFFKEYLEKPNIKKAVERLDKSISMKREVPYEFIMFLEDDVKVLTPLYLHLNIPRGCPEIDDEIINRDNIDTGVLIYKLKEKGSYAQIKKYNEKENKCSKTFNYITLQYLYNGFNGKLAPKITKLDACYNTNLDKCQENVYFNIKEYKALNNKDILYKWFEKGDKFFEKTFGLVKYSYEKANIMAISPILDNFIEVEENELRLMGWNNSLIINRNAEEIGNYSFIMKDILFKNNTVLIHWAVDSFILYYNLAFEIYKIYGEKCNEKLGKLTNYYYTNVIKDLIELGFDDALEETNILFWKQIISNSGITMNKYIDTLLRDKAITRSEDLRKLYKETAILKEFFRKMIGSSRLTIFIDSNSLCLADLAKEGWKYKSPKFMGSGSFGIVFQVCKSELHRDESDCSYVFKVQNAIRRSDLDINNDIVVYNIIGEDGGGIAPRFYGYKTCPYVNGSFISKKPYEWTGIGIYQKMKGNLYSILSERIETYDDTQDLLSILELERIFEILRKLHNLDIIHYDSKLDNFLMGFDDNQIYITDFGFSKQVNKYTERNAFYTGILVDYSKLYHSLDGVVDNETLEMIKGNVKNDVKELLEKGAVLDYSTIPDHLNIDVEVIKMLDESSRIIKKQEMEN